MSAPIPASDGSPYRWHIGRTVTLAVPIIISRVGLVILFTVDSLMAGHAGGLQLAGLGLGTAPLLTVMLVCLGALQSTVVLASQSIGRGDHSEVGLIFRAGIINGVLLGLGAALLSLWAEDFFLFTGQDPQVSAIAAGVAKAFAWGLPGQLLFLNANLILEATGRPRPGMLIMLIANLANVLLDGVFVLGWGGLAEPGGAVMAIATSSVVRWGTFIAAFMVLLRVDRQLGDIFGIAAPISVWMREIRSLGGRFGGLIRRMGLPMGLGQGVESSAFSTFTFFAGNLGAPTLAAHQTTMTVMSLVYMNAVGIGGAASIRVGNAVGRRFPLDLRRAGISAIGLGGLFSGICGVAMVAIPHQIAGLFVSDPEVIAIATQTMMIGGFIVGFDAMMGVSMGALRGLGDVWIPLWMQSAAFWAVGVPLAWALSLHWQFGAPGLFYGIGGGTAASLALLAPRFLRAAKLVAKSWSGTPK